MYAPESGLRALGSNQNTVDEKKTQKSTRKSTPRTLTQLLLRSKGQEVVHYLLQNLNQVSVRSLLDTDLVLFLQSSMCPQRYQKPEIDPFPPNNGGGC